ncbi:hypothetical protein LOTGIDRAFT_169098 [Lottia gigantea]|uniref:C-type lectin domain-containing protein n=1 Tax=Lottia gigantea TaxID=225164 RepID=V3YZJ9_LOTGI|nr:hypothetical protein LOTGIDRAFT_169098 [Lottia gigantea]ESO83628.1 hypothetical protein LOTGIDRAFT_169098 [Lottia gigantea]
MPIATIQDGRCYCFKLNSDTPRGNVALSSFFVKTAREADCVSKGYNVYSSLGVCIKFSGNSKKDFPGAQETCNQDGGYLIKVDSQTKINTAMSLVTKMTELVFIGAFTYQKGQDYLNVKGGKLDPQFWDSNEPDSVGADICAGLPKISGVLKGVADVGCEGVIPFFCELLL